MKSIKISIIGNSVGLRVRPPQKFPNNKNYGSLLKEYLEDKYRDHCIIVNNLCVGRSTVLNILENRDELIREFPDYYILNVGVTDASTREIPLWFSNILASKKETVFRLALMAVYLYFFVKIRRFLVLLRGKKTWVSKNNYKKYLEKLVFTLKKETNAELIILSINPSTGRIDSELPGSHSNYILYSNISKSIAEKYDCYFIDTSDLDPGIHVPDGIHLSSKGNDVIAKKLLPLLQRKYF